MSNNLLPAKNNGHYTVVFWDKPAQMCQQLSYSPVWPPVGGCVTTPSPCMNETAEYLGMSTNNSTFNVQRLDDH